MTFTLHFFAPDWDREPDMIERRDQRIRLIDYDEVTMSHRVEFPDGTRRIVYANEILSRESE